MKSLLCFCLLCFIASNVCAQRIVVTGFVLDDVFGEPLIGVAVERSSSDKDNNNPKTVITDLDGQYSIKVLPNETLKFSFIGYKTQKIKVNKRFEINVLMEAKDDRLTPSCFGIPSFSHSIMATMSYSKGNKIGYGLDYNASYGYFDPCKDRQKIMNMLGSGFAIKDISPSDSEYLLNPYMSFWFPPDLSFRYKRNTIFVSPHLNIGYYWDTDFKKIGKHNLSYGGGVQVSLTTIRVFGGPHNLWLVTGYSAYRDHSSNNHFYLGVKMRLRRNKTYILM